MLQFAYKLKLTERVKAKCSRLPATAPRKMAAPAFAAAVPPVSHCTTSTRLALY